VGGGWLGCARVVPFVGAAGVAGVAVGLGWGVAVDGGPPFGEEGGE